MNLDPTAFVGLLVGLGSLILISHSSMNFPGRLEPLYRKRRRLNRRRAFGILASFVMITLSLMLLLPLTETLWSKMSPLVLVSVMAVCGAAAFAEQQTTWKELGAEVLWGPALCPCCGSIEHSRRSSCQFPSSSTTTPVDWTPVLQALPDQAIGRSKHALELRMRALMSLTTPAEASETDGSGPFGGSIANMDGPSLIRLARVLKVSNLANVANIDALRKAVADRVAFKQNIRSRNRAGTSVTSEFPFQCSGAADARLSIDHLNDWIIEFNDLPNTDDTFLIRWIEAKMRLNCPECGNPVSFADL
jgi:hypothetical protein